MNKSQAKKEWWLKKGPTERTLHMRMMAKAKNNKMTKAERSAHCRMMALKRHEIKKLCTAPGLQ